jgi:acetyl-CoA acetyltransferase
VNLENVYVVGVAMTPFGKLMDRSVKDLTQQVVGEALNDAGLARTDLDAAYYANCTQGIIEGQNAIRGPIALRSAGVEGIPIVTVENACASGATAFNLAVQYVKAGDGEVALAVGVEKMYSTDKARMLSVFDSGWDIHAVDETRDGLLKLGEGVVPPAGTTSPKPYSVFMDVYAAFCRFHMRRFGLTQRQIAAVASKNHRHSVENARSQFRDAYSVEQVLAAPPITYPLTLPMCSPISDGGAAAIVCSEKALARFGIGRKRAVRVRASVLRSGTTRSADDVGQHLTAIAARQAYERASVGPGDISVAEVHDATAMGEIIQTENLGLCKPGDGGALAERGDTTLGGRIPVNPSGGLESKGHPIGATGLGQIFELVGQLRGEAGARQVEGARLAIAENGGGLIGIEEAVASVVILGQ